MQVFFVHEFHYADRQDGPRLAPSSVFDANR